MQTTQTQSWRSIWLGRRPAADEDRSVLAGVASGDRRAFEELHARFGRPLFGYLLTLTPDRGLAEEILQDTLVAIWQNAGAYAGRSSVKTWLFGVARRQAHNKLRGRKFWLADEEELKNLPASEPDPEAALLTRTRREDLAASIGHLSPLYREVLALVFFHELSYEETAEVLGVPVGTVKSRLSNAKRALRSLMQKEQER